MTRFYQALKQNRRTKSGETEPGNGTSPADLSQVNAIRATSVKKKSYGSTTPLFAADPEENVRLWMQKYFGDVRVSREDAIRHWLSRPPESRVHTFTDSPAKTEAGAEPSVSVLESSVNVPPASGVLDGGNVVNSARLPRFMPASVGTAEADRSRSWPKLVFRVGMYSLAAVVLVTLLWAIPVKHRATTQASSATAAQSKPTASALDSQGEDSSSSEVLKLGAARADSDAPTQPSRIESISIGCEAAQPCIEVHTSGPQIRPDFSTLTRPDRLVMDFAGAEYRSGVHQIAEKRGVVKGVRIRGIVEDRSPSTRVVIDLTAQSDSVMHSLQNKYVVEIRPKNSSN